jgi:hypothetical protein
MWDLHIQVSAVDLGGEKSGVPSRLGVVAFSDLSPRLANGDFGTTFFTTITSTTFIAGGRCYVQLICS